MTKAVTSCFPTCNHHESDIDNHLPVTPYLDNVGCWQQEAMSSIIIVLWQLKCVAVVNVLSDVPENKTDIIRMIVGSSY